MSFYLDVCILNNIVLSISISFREIKYRMINFVFNKYFIINKYSYREKTAYVYVMNIIINYCFETFAFSLV